MSERVNLVKSLAKTVDDFLDKVVDFFEATAPSRLAKKAGLPPAPGEVVDSAVGSALHEVRKAPAPSAVKKVKEEVKRIVK
jgi:hypothetical protein